MATTNNTIRSKNSKATSAAQLIVGAKKHFPNGSQQIMLGGASITIDAATNELQTFVNNRAAVVAAQATAKTQVAVETAQMPALSAFLGAFREFIEFTFRTKADILADFGITPPKARTPMTAEQKAVAVAKRAATRAARGTQGAKAKKAVHGNITAQLVVTPGPAKTTEAPPSAPSPAPAAAAPTGGGTTAQH